MIASTVTRNGTTVNQRPPSTKRLVCVTTRYDFGLMFFLLALVALRQPLIIKAELNGVEACQNECLHLSECKAIGNGLCCRWDDSLNQCVSSIGNDICHGTAIMSPVPSTPPIACTPKAIKRRLTEDTHQIISAVEEEESIAPSLSPKSRWDWCVNTTETARDWHLCMGYDWDVDEWTTRIITLKISSGLSILGSTYIIQDVLRDPNKRKESVYHRIMIGLSCSDIIFSLVFFLGTWVMPKGSHLFSYGSESMCSAVGFFFATSALCTPLYNCSLATFYLLKLKYSWVNRKVKAVEKWLLFLPITVGLIEATFTAVIGGTGPMGLACAVNSIIPGFIGIFIAIFSLGFVSITMFLVYRSVRRVEKDALQYSFPRYSSSKRNDTSMSRRVMVQGILYSVVLFSMIFPAFVLAVVLAVTSSIEGIGYTAGMVMSIIIPLQGFFNAIIYMIPLFQRMIKKRCKTKQNIPSPIQDQQTISKTWLIRWKELLWTKMRTSKTSRKKGKTSGQIEAEQEGESKEEEGLVDINSRVDVSKQNPLPRCNIKDANSKQKQQEVLHFKTISESSGTHKSEKEKIKGEDTNNNNNVGAMSSLMISCVAEAEEEEAIKPSSFGLPSYPTNSQLNNKEEEHSNLEYFSALEANTEIYDNGVNNEGNESDDESDIDDYLKMMKD